MIEDRIHRRREHIRARRRRRRARRADRTGPFTAGLILLALGAAFLLQRLEVTFDGVRLDISTLWPFFMIFGGAGMLVGFVFTGLRHPERVTSGVTTALIGWFFLAITLGPLEWGDLGTWWPVFPLICGIGIFAGFLASFGRRLDQIPPAIASTAVGVLGLLFMLTPLRTVLGVVGWPLLLIVIGAAMLAKGVLVGLFRAFAVVSRQS